MARKIGSAKTSQIQHKTNARIAAKHDQRLSATAFRRQLTHESEIKAALTHFQTMSARDLIQRRNKHAEKLREKAWPQIAIDRVLNMNAREYRAFLINRLFHRHAD